jgi:hypothetical protein
MSVNINSRIFRSINENIKLIYYHSKDSVFSFSILGTSGFIYEVIIDKKIQTCICEDYCESKFCKHICFILFKFLKVFRLNKKNLEIKVPYQNKLYSTSFFETLEFSEFEWMVFMNRYRRIKLYIKPSFFNYEFYNSFLLIYNRYLINVKNKLIESTDKCAICLNSNYPVIKCPICNNEYHVSCLVSWFKKLNGKKRCPTCTNLNWDFLYPSLLYANNDKIPFDLL